MELTSLKNIGEGAINLPCLFNDVKCVNPDSMLAQQGIAIGSKVNITLPKMDFDFDFTFQITLPHLGVQSLILPIQTAISNALNAEDAWPVGKVLLDGISHKSTDRNYFIAEANVHFENASTFRKLQELPSNVNQLMLIIKGTESSTTLLNKAFSHINENFTVPLNRTNANDEESAETTKPHVNMNVQTDASNIIFTATLL